MPLEQAFFLVFAPLDTTLAEMVRAIGERWRIEQRFEIGKGEVGLDDDVLIRLLHSFTITNAE